MLNNWVQQCIQDNRLALTKYTMNELSMNMI
jgi:hypothetical protein